MDFEVLGPLQVSVAGQPVVVSTAPKRLLALAALLARAGQPVPVDTLVEAVWGQRPPASARRNLQLYVHGFRRIFGDGLIATRGDGYMLGPGSNLDSLRFRRLAADGAAALDAGDPATAATDLRAALDLWRGPAFAEFLDCELVAQEAARLELLRVETFERWAEAQLVTGATLRLVAELTELCRLHPYRESLRALLMRALYQTGRRVEALTVFRETRALLIDEVGMEPGLALQRLHEAMLRGDEALGPPARPDGVVPVTPTVAVPQPPRQLPAPPLGFTGRAAELAALDQVHGVTTVVISAIDGMAGIGKTALAVHWAHTVRDRFPDGQLYANLRGFDPAGPPARPAEVLREFLEALQVPAAGIPASLEARTGLYRTLLAARRMLILLDNARDADQVRPLLPGSAGCLAVVTSRNRLTGLVALDGAHPLHLDLLAAAEARDLLTARLGAPKIDAAPAAAVNEIIGSCAGLPLALAIVAARAAVNPSLPLAALAAELPNTRGGPDAFTDSDPTIDIRAIFSASYKALPAETARLFRMIGLHPGPDFTASALASTAGVPPACIPPVLAELTRANLVTEHLPGRYTLHDLLRSYAIELAQLASSDEQHAAIGRMLDHYLHGTHAAARLLSPHRELVTPPAARPNVSRVDLSDHEHAMAWLNAEYPILLRVIELASASGFDAHTGQFAWALTTFFYRRARFDDWITAANAALEAAQRQGDLAGQALSHRGLARAYTRLRRDDDAYTHLQHALALAVDIGDVTAQAHTHLNIAGHLVGQQRYQTALDHAQRAHRLYRTAEHDVGRAKALNALGYCLSLLGKHDAGLAACQRALSLQQAISDSWASPRNVETSP